MIGNLRKSLYRQLASVIAAFVLMLTVFSAELLAQPKKAAETCAACQNRNYRQCKGKCLISGVPPVRQTTCYVDCQTSQCAKLCSSIQVPTEFNRKPGRRIQAGFGTPGDTVEIDGDEKTSCESCLRKKERTICADLCADVGERGICRKRCAKRECAYSCDLPVKSLKVKEKRLPPGARDCPTCKRTSQTKCKDRCGTDTERAGYTACVVSCVEERCLKPCNPQLFQ